MEDTFGVALVKEACPLCAKVEDGPIIINQMLTKPAADKVRELHGKTIGMMENPCKECQSMMEKGILLIGVVEELSDDPKNPYRSGNQWVVTEDFIRRTFGDIAEVVIKKGCSFFTVEAAKSLGFPDTKEESDGSPK